GRGADVVERSGEGAGGDREAEADAGGASGGGGEAAGSEDGGVLPGGGAGRGVGPDGPEPNPDCAVAGRTDPGTRPPHATVANADRSWRAWPGVPPSPWSPALQPRSVLPAWRPAIVSYTVQLLGVVPRSHSPTPPST